LLIEALQMQGLDVPNFCYYKNLPAQASCRMCLVRIEKMPRLQPSCTTVVRDGMVIDASSDEIKEMRRGMLEFMLANHPLDCPVCDRGGECELQDMVFKFGKADARFTEEKHAQPEIDISSFIYNDAQRCIFCYRCTRVCDLWMDVGALAKLNRGTHETIGTFDGWLDCEHCGNCVDVCPTGTLMHISYKYGPRPWNLDETETTCNYCADGCRVRLGSRNNTVYRSVARQGTGINEEYLCVKGRYGMGFINAKERLVSPLLRKEGELQPVSWSEALDFVAARLSEVKATSGAESIALFGSRRVTNEGNFAVAHLARALGTPNVARLSEFDLETFLGSADGRLATRDDIYGADTILVLGGDPKEYQPLTAYFVLQAVMRFKAKLYVAASRKVRIRKRAEQFLHIRPGSHAALLAALARPGEISLNAARAGCSEAEIARLRGALDGADRMVVMLGPELDRASLTAAAGLATLLGRDPEHVRYRPLVEFNNSVGAFDALGAWQPLKEAGPLLQEAGGKVRALYAVGADLLGGPDAAEVAERLRGLDLLVVQDLFASELGKLAHVVLPACSFAEQDGTFTNLAGEVQRVHKAIDPVGGARPDWMAPGHVARLLESDPGYRNSAARVFAAMAEVVPAYAGISYAELMRRGPIQTRRQAATPSAATLLQVVADAAARVDDSLPMDDSPVAMGEGLFALGATARRAPLLAQAFATGASKGRSVEEEDALILGGIVRT
jgi:NADH-quinone oxidoreductase subunit G